MKRHPRPGILAALAIAAVFTLTFVLSPLAAWSAPAPAETTTAERKAVLAVVQAFFDTMAAKDVEGARATLLPDGQYYAVRPDPVSAVQRRTHEEYLERLATGKERSLERMWDPTVMLHGRVAVVWTPYDYHRNGNFSHSGIDVFTLVRTAAGWRIASLVFTVEPATPSQHPAGPPPDSAGGRNYNKKAGP